MAFSVMLEIGGVHAHFNTPLFNAKTRGEGIKPDFSICLKYIWKFSYSKKPNLKVLSDQLWSFYGYGYIFEKDNQTLAINYQNNTKLARTLEALDMVSILVFDKNV